jgi:hypothetical protein
MCKHSFIKTTGKKSKKVTWYCINEGCTETRVEQVKPVSPEFKIKKK